ncbi:hypothetical protein AGMMS49545_09860 [Betaproteobacteria bacterium]|nr:hypothetical protein AGMMS49545_09860 [Betaproteobacteria bacterium]GHU42553.1 hypothetical protein AGMMS50289_07450 [Betaproteobacteria bacterium]
MRTLVFILIFANLLVFAYAQGYFGVEVSPDAAHLAQQVKPERLQLMWRPGEAPAAATVARLSTTLDNAPDESTTSTCLLLSGLQSADADRLAELAMTAQLTVVQRSESWWVFIPPQSDRAAAEKKATELTGLGIRDFTIVNEEGAQQFAISLGVYSREENANRRLEELRDKKVRSARVGPRRLENARQTLEVRGDAITALSFRQTLPAGVLARDCP